MANRHLKWELIARMNTRSCSYSKRDLIAALEAAGCRVMESREDIAPAIIARQILVAVRHLAPDEDPVAVREEVTSRIRIVHPKVPRRFKGIFET